MSEKTRPWRPLVRATTPKELPAELVATTARRMDMTQGEAVAFLKTEFSDAEFWVNPLYQVQVKRSPELVWINIRRRDGKAIVRDWRHFQRIKNEVVGPECEAVELYPAESRLVDESNKYHLFCIPDPSYRFPFGFESRSVRYESGTLAGLQQRAEND
jgi:hypothetical protein